MVFTVLGDQKMGEFIPKFERDLDSRSMGPKALPTAGAIAVLNEKGEITMQKVKVVRYMAGKMLVSLSYVKIQEYIYDHMWQKIILITLASTCMLSKLSLSWKSSPFILGLLLVLSRGL